MRHWIIVALVAIVATALTQGFAPFAQSGAAQDKQTKPIATKASAPQAPAKPAGAKPSAAEQALFDAANRERAARGLRPLQWSAALAAAARAHAQKMAQENRLEHQFPGEMDLGTRIRRAGVRFRAAAENVAQGPSAAVIHAQWMNSPPHRGNLLDPELDSIGIAVAERSGQLFAVQDFSQASP